MSSNLKDRFVASLKNMFEQVEAEFRKAQVERHEEVANGQFESWMERLTKPPVKDCRYLPSYIVNEPGEYVTKDISVLNDESCYSPNYDIRWVYYNRIKAAGGYGVNLERARKDANDCVDAAKAHFLAKQSQKLTTACTSRTDEPTEITGHLAMGRGGRVAGSLTVKFANGDEFNVTMQVIVNHRSTRGSYTSFYQFPTRFVNVMKGDVCRGKHVSEKWMEKYF